MLSASDFLSQLSWLGIDSLSGVPCSLLSSLLSEAQRWPQGRYTAASSEGDAIAIASGVYLGGKLAAVLMQNSGLGNAVNPLTSLSIPFEIPCLLLVSLRGDPAGNSCPPHHQPMGAITTDLLELMSIPWQYLSNEPEACAKVLQNARDYMLEKRRPYALVVRRDTFEAAEYSHSNLARTLHYEEQKRGLEALHFRPEFLAVLNSKARSEDRLIATTGHTSRELHSLGDSPNCFYMSGSMGCASGIGLGLAFSQTDQRIYVLDGDAALCMRLGNLAVVGKEQPKNLVHIVFDNGVNQSTGGQRSPSQGIDFCQIALACGYHQAFSINRPNQLDDCLDSPGPVLIHIPVKESAKTYSRPQVKLPEITRRFRELCT